ncbi:endolytic transglycosylase MltG [Actinomarinicola tropica]|uniref:Endolytic murein transglycosylase n=1 Tax=Actinomarinicola tropica TaxID=2789776 RepID=A0A5Q2RM52_9ACTN|nr:endolytic transglycosylase MltG [Actinomarinicola tropica]QGG95167.1 endolytic transglycosylase MltG [Actinomarinicola tropica]
MSDRTHPDDERLPPGVPSRRAARREAAVGASRPADAYPGVDVVDPDDDGADEWLWDDGQYVRVVRPAGNVRKVLYLLIGAVLVVGLAGAAGLSWVRGQIDPAGEPGAAVPIDIATGTSTDEVATLLADEGVVTNPTMFRYYLRWKGIGGFEAGFYTLNENMSFDEAIEVLDAGPAPQAFATFTVPEGLTVDEMAVRLDEQIDTFSADDMSAALIRMETPWRPPDVDSWEGLLFPDTYEYALADEPFDVLERMNAQFDIVAREVGLDPWMNLDPATATGYTAYQYVVIASMIEEESRVPEEFGRISRVIHNRLARGEPLGIDATVLYARQLADPNASGPITDADLALDSPYNTRLNPGLPPTPIAAPGRAALAAALNPEPGPWLYYVLASEDGSHFFTDDYDEFIRQRDESRAQGLF